MHKIQNDKPVNAESQDSFQRYGFAKHIANIVASQQLDTSLVVGLYGRWGEGKTSVMNFVRQELPKQILIVNFNPWLFSNELHLLKAFFESIMEALERSLKTSKEKISDFFADYASALGAITQLAGVSMDGVKSMGEKLGSVSIEKLKDRVDQAIVKSGKKIAVFIDDIDRLDVNEIQAVFKLVKLVGDFPRTTYILSFDDEVVSTALSPKYADDKSTSNAFLEKIIQLPIQIPKASTLSLRNYTLERIVTTLKNYKYDLSDSELGDFLDIFESSFLPIIDNPRSGVRYSNAVAFAFPLLKGAVNIVDLLAIEGCKIYYPELYSYIRNNPKLFVHLDEIKGPNRDKGIVERVDAVIGGYSEPARKGAKNLVGHLFPRVQPMLKGKPRGYSDLLLDHDAWYREKRICSGKYFDRYFSFACDKSDILDSDLEKILELAKNGDVIDSLTAEIKDLASRFSPFELIQLIRVREGELSNNQVHNLGLAISNTCDSFPKEPSIPIFTTRMQSIRLLCGFVRRLETDQLSFAIRLVENAGTTDYAIELCQRLLEKNKYKEPAEIFAGEEADNIKDITIQRYLGEVNRKNFGDLASDSSTYKVLCWAYDSTTYKERLLEFLGKGISNADFAFKLLSFATPSIITLPMNSKVSYSYKTKFDESTFDFLSKMVDVSKLNAALVKKFGMNPYDGDISKVSDDDDYELDQETLVSVFQWYLVNHTHLHD